MKQQIFVSTACLSSAEPLGARISNYARIGIRNIELGMRVIFEEDWLNILKSANLAYTVHNYFPSYDRNFVLNLSSPNKENRKRSIESALESLSIARELNSAVYSIHGGFIKDPISVDSDGFIFPDGDYAEVKEWAFEYYLDSMSKIIPYAEKYGIKLLIENNICQQRNAGKLLFCDSEDYLRLFENIKSRFLGCLIDTEHVTESARVLGFERNRMVSLLQSRIFAYHLSFDYLDFIQNPEMDVYAWEIEILKNLRQDQIVILENPFSTLNELQLTYNYLIKEDHEESDTF